MAYVICPLSDAGQARSVLGTAFQGVERIRIGQGERLTLLIWWNQERSWTVSWHVGLEVGSVVLSAGQAACCSAGSALPLVVTDCSTLWTVPTPSKRPPADHDDGSAGHGHLQSGGRTDRALAGAPVHPSAAIPLSRPPGRAAFAPDLADGFSVRFRSDHLMGLRPDSTKEIKFTSSRPEITGLRPCSPPEKGTRKGDY